MFDLFVLFCSFLKVETRWVGGFKMFLDALSRKTNASKKRFLL